MNARARAWDVVLEVSLEFEVWRLKFRPFPPPALNSLPVATASAALDRVLFAIEQSRDCCELHIAYCGLYVRGGLR